MLTPWFGKMPHGGVRRYGGFATYGYWHEERFIYFIKRKTYKAHRLICEAFNGPPQSGEVCMHLDENSANNVPSNLAWGTQKENLNAPGFLEYCRNRTGENSPATKGLKKRRGVSDG